ncbi:MAG TPA: DUF4157 domain-containing protein, partial [Bacteroidia bacterium]|nr:DUF4157 domain-containing protein [Bacteroidia bacterium]
MSDFAAPKVQAPVSGSHVASQWGGGEMDGMEAAPLVQGPEAAHLSQLQAAANQSPQVQQFRQLQAGIDQSEQVQQFHKHQQGINNAVSQRKENRTGLPDDLKSGIEGLSGMSMDDVRVHYNSDKPAAMQAHAFAQGSEIHVASGQERHLPHEAWHVVQQKQGRVKPTAQLKQAPINDDDALEREADVMGAKALSAAGTSLPVADGGSTANEIQLKSIGGSPAVVQRKMGIEFETGIQAFDMGKFSDKLARSKESPVEKPTYTPDDLSLKSESKEGAKQYFHENFGVQQDRTMWKGNGIQIDSDNSKLEFVTEPAVPFDEFEAPLKELAKTADSLPGQLDACAPIDQVLTNGKNQGPYYLVPYPFKKLTFGKVTGSPQITLGIPYSKLFDFMEFLSKYEMQASMRLHGRQAMNVENNLPELDKWANDESVNEEEGKRRKKKAGERKNTFHDSLNSEKEKGFRAIENAEVKNFIDISGKVKSILHQALEKDEELSKLKIDPAEEAKLRGILHMTGQYAQYACDYKGYKYKKIAFPVLMRTSFAALFQALSKQAQQVFVKT